ncbi:hypothetical protein COW99_03815 [Candidatus Roizmanbacteria bacterium CG22_combo_CG10-13_8_21_14_all_38_20]|uniref:Helix-turn-helix domain-containing protein n=1 Tax=Candidatus Roizmanbacteria bacterium CG22_combo_CG10-13_8_21_14_all_38_20 TaxID=1974862 RepID=A0A2H0BX05_9BACT|nr:helix-turn-helix domain-containing protein [Candidatus Microgenomates bacterium]PIP61518.1 MAG: hypothetical protein COW99_03815 [Candidatus Roizmanbacteria bacterium CG22_combo_CG10-13_8_21_14_all_38_20]PJC32284.1 MAG: hypothetical protein CO050_00490 [Candidatus Roizmanbacteria bacterium CG_4_9_14_0_2_um_filter_38_17]
MQTIYSTAQVSYILQLSRITVRRYIKDGKLRGSKIGRGYRVKESDLIKLLNKTCIN